MRFIKHGGYKDSLYVVWNSKRERCYNSRYYNYINYGGRGIKISPAWKEYQDFKVWAISSGYKKGLHIDRINNDGNYEPENCRWVTCKENSRNKRNTIYLTYNGNTKPLADWADDIGVARKTLWARIKRGWSIDRAIETKTDNK